MASRLHTFAAVAFEENLNLRDLHAAFPEAKPSPIDLHIAQERADTFIYPFGAIVFHDVGNDRRNAELTRLHSARPGLKTKVVREEYAVREDDGAAKIGFEAGGVLVIDRMTPGRASVIALTVGQSAAMEYYERIVESLFGRTGDLVSRMERHGTVPARIRPMHKFIGEAIATRTEVLQVLHLLDKPDAAWDDPGMSDIYDDLRAEFDLVDRYQALELKLRAVQEALELVLDVARDRRLVWLEVSIVLLIVADIVVSFLPGH